MDNSNNSIFLIDGSALLYRSFYGLAPLKTSKGVSTQAIFGFFRSIKNLVEKHGARRLVIAWDERKSIRKKEYAEYKAKRLVPPDDLLLQKKKIEQIAKSMGILQFSSSGYEADDVIATLALKHSSKAKIVVVASDKDLLQLITDKIVALDLTKNKLIDKRTFFEKYGFEPTKLTFYHALVGDSSDNIPGVKGIGAKSAEKLVKKYKDLKDLYAHLDEVQPARIKTLLENGEKDAILSLKLFTLRKCPVTAKISQTDFDPSQWADADSLFSELEMFSLTSNPEVAKTKKKSEAKKVGFKYDIITSEQDLIALAKELKKKKAVAVDTETTGLDWCKESLVGISIASDTKSAYYIPIAHGVKKEKNGQKNLFDTASSGQLSLEIVSKELSSVLLDKKILKIMHHAKFDLHFLRNAGIEVAGDLFDTMIAARLLRPEWQKVGLKGLSKEILGESMRELKDVGKGKKDFSKIPIEDAAEYAAHDALQTFKLKGELDKQLNKQTKLKKIFYDVEIPLCKVLFDMESNGVLLDSGVLKKIETSVKTKLKKIDDKIRSAIKGSVEKNLADINLNSPKQVSELLFKVLKLPDVGKKRGGGTSGSTGKNILLELSKVHPIPEMILRYREFTKLLSTYLQPLPESVCEKTGRVHTSYSQVRVATGRLSSSDPNLQNIPLSGDGKVDIRSAFVADRGNVLLSADYSQIELRVLAHLSGDKSLVETYKKSEDLHVKTAANIYEVDLKKVTQDQRQVGKRINFSVLYGLTPYSLARELEIPVAEAKRSIEAFFEGYPGVAKWMEKTVTGAQKNGFVETWLGRKRDVPGIKDRNKMVFEAARRIAINTPAQGTAAEIMKIAMINLYKKLEKDRSKAKILLQVHDELILEIKKSDLRSIEKNVKNAMESVVKWEVPLVVDMRSGKNWGEITK
ncbi:DNA polymerase I [Candidatus Dependentiae bacterium]